MKYTKSFPVYPPITNPQSNKAPIAEFLNPAAYKFAPTGESHRFFIPALIYKYLLEKTQSLITRLGKMEDKINSLTKDNEHLVANVVSLTKRYNVRHESYGFLAAKLEERDQQIERLKSAVEFQKDVIDRVEKHKNKGWNLFDSVKKSSTKSLKQTIDTKDRELARLEQRLCEVRKALGGDGFTSRVIDEPAYVPPLDSRGGVGPVTGGIAGRGILPTSGPVTINTPFFPQSRPATMWPQAPAFGIPVFDGLKQRYQDRNQDQINASNIQNKQNIQQDVADTAGVQGVDGYNGQTVNISLDTTAVRHADFVSGVKNRYGVLTDFDVHNPATWPRC